MEVLLDFVRDGLWQAVLWALPIFGAAVTAAVVAGWLAARVGLSDPSLSIMVRVVAVVLALALMGRALGERAQTLARDAFSRLPALGRGAIEP